MNLEGTTYRKLKDATTAAVGHRFLYAHELEGGSRFYVWAPSPSYFIERYGSTIMTHHLPFYEVLGHPRPYMLRMYGDIDAHWERDDTEIMKAVEHLLETTIAKYHLQIDWTDSRVEWMTAHSSEKQSFHFICHFHYQFVPVLFESTAHCKAFVKLLKHVATSMGSASEIYFNEPRHKFILDEHVYGSTQNFRMPYCSKAGQNRPFVSLTDCPYEDLLIQTEDDGSLLVLPEQCHIPKVCRDIAVSVQPSQQLDVDLSFLGSVPVASCKLIRAEDGREITYVQTIPGVERPCPIAKALRPTAPTHHNRGFNIEREGEVVYYICHRCNTLFSPMKYRLSVRTPYAVNETDWLSPTEVCEHYIPPDSVDWTASTIIIQSQCGTGKTCRVLSWVEELVQASPAIRIIIFTSRISLARQFYGRYAALGFQLYSQCDKRQLHKVPRLICQFESAVWLCQDGERTQPYDVVIIDEIEALTAQSESPTAYGRLRKIVGCLDVLTRVASKCVLMDAYLSPRSARFIKRARPPLRYSYTILSNTWINTDRCYFLHKDFEQWYEILFDAVKQNSRVVLPIMSIKLAKAILHKIQIARPTTRVLLLCSDTSKDEAAEFCRGPDAFIDSHGIQILVYTSSVTVGVDITTPFSEVFAASSSRAGPARQLMQMLARVRTITTNRVRIFLHRQFNTSSMLPVTYDEVRASMSKKAETLSKLGINYHCRARLEDDGLLSWYWRVDEDALAVNATYNIVECNKSHNNFMDALLEFLNVGFQIIEMIPEKNSKAPLKILQEDVEAVSVQEAAQIAAASDITASAYETLKRRATGDELDRDRIKRFKIKHAFGYADAMPSTEELITVTDSFHQKGYERYCSIVHTLPQQLYNADLAENANPTKPELHLQDCKSLTAFMLDAFLKIAGFDDDVFCTGGTTTTSKVTAGLAVTENRIWLEEYRTAVPLAFLCGVALPQELLVPSYIRFLKSLLRSYLCIDLVRESVSRPWVNNQRTTNAIYKLGGEALEYYIRRSAEQGLVINL